MTGKLTAAVTSLQLEIQVYYLFSVLATPRPAISEVDELSFPRDRKR